MADKKKKTEGKGTRTTHHLFDPADLIRVTDEKHYAFDPRVHDGPEEGLVLSIMEYGVLEPILINRKLEILAGRKRHAAATEANKRLKKKGLEPVQIPAIFKAGEEGRLFGMGQAENIHHAETIKQKAVKVSRYMDMGHTIDDAVITFGVTKTAIKQWLSVLEADAAVQKEAEKGTLPESAIVQLAGLKPEDQKEALGELKQKLAAGGKVTVKDAKEVVQKKKAKRSGKSESDVRTNPAIPKRKVVRLVLGAQRLQNDQAAATETVEEGLAKYAEDHTYLDILLLGMRLACGDKATSSVKGFNALLEEVQAL